MAGDAPSEAPRSPSTVDLALRQQVAAGAFWGWANFVLGVFLGLPLTVLLVRTMSREQFGVLAIATSVVTFGVVLAGLGLNSAVAQIGSRGGEPGSPRYAGPVAGALAIARRIAVVATVAGVLVLGGLWFVPNLRITVVVVAVMAPLVMLAPFAAALRGMLQCLFAVRRTAVVDGSTLVVTVSLSVLAILTDRVTAVDLGVARSVGGVVGAVVLWRVARPWLRDVRAAEAAQASVLLPFALAMMLNSIEAMVVSMLDVFWVGVEMGPTQAGMYAPISRVADMTLAFSVLFAGFLLPALVAARKSDPTSVPRLYHWSSRWSLAMSAPLLALMVISPAAFLSVLFGADFASLAGPARILGAGLVIQVVLGFNGMTLDAHGIPRLVVRRSVAGIVVGAVACPLLIATFGLDGAAAATSLTLVVVNGYSSVVLNRRFGVRPWDIAVARTTLLFGVALGCAWTLSNATGATGWLQCAITAGAPGYSPLLERPPREIGKR